MAREKNKSIRNINHQSFKYCQLREFMLNGRNIGELGILMPSFFKFSSKIAMKLLLLVSNILLVNDDYTHATLIFNTIISIIISYKYETLVINKHTSLPTYLLLLFSL